MMCPGQGGALRSVEAGHAGCGRRRRRRRWAAFAPTRSDCAQRAGLTNLSLLLLRPHERQGGRSMADEGEEPEKVDTLGIGS